MARPAAEIIDRITTRDNADWYILEADDYYVITYQGRPINLKTVSGSIKQPIKYKKTGYSNEGNARAAVRRLNDVFMTEDFSYVKLGAQDANAHR